MISKQRYLDSALKEIAIFKHLYTKILPGTLDYKPTEKQRSTLELLQYVAYAFALELKGIVSGSIGDMRESMAVSKTMPADEFPSKMDELAQLVTVTVNGISDEELAKDIDLFGRGKPQARAAWLLELVLKNMVGYKMQLFLYIKASGNSEVGTRDVWQGVS